jgi:hypothetical protein
MQRTAIIVLAWWGWGCGGGSTDPADAGAIDAQVADAAAAFVPGDPLVLTAGSAGNDEDPAVLRARDGTIYVAWFSQAAGNDILISRTADGVSWSPPVQVSTGAATDFGPSLYEDDAGVIHAVWFRWAGAAPPGKVIYNRTGDGLSWNQTTEVEVTTATGTDDWVPTITANPAGDLVVAFARNTCPPPTCFAIAVTTSADGAAWSAPVPAVTAGAGVEHHLPAIANVGGELALVWNPFDEAAGAPWEATTSGAHVAVSTSPDGASWAAAVDVTSRVPDEVSVFPTLFADHAGAWHVAWMAADATGSGVVEVALEMPAAPATALPITGYSPKLVATPTSGVYLAAWVEGPPGERDIVVRVFAED